MPKSKIISLPHSSLRKVSKRVHVITDDVTDIVQDMKEATLEWENSRKHEVGVALAAVQINCLQRIVIIRHDFNDKSSKDFDVLINPEITKYEGDIEEDYEGCLSVVDVYGKVPRHTKVRVKAKTLDGQEIKLKAEGFLARILQHEIDHTKGKLFVDLIKNQPEKLYKLASSGKIEKLDPEEIQNAVCVLW